MSSIKSSLDLSHYPVMVNEVIKICDPEKESNFIDCTFGGGGYTKELLKFPNTKVIALDRDKNAKNRSEILSNKYQKRFTFYNEKFSRLENIINKDSKADAVIFDLGLSSFQLLDMSRGFSFKSKQKIDMNMGLSSISAEEILNNCDENSLKSIIKVLGEEKEASRIVKNIIRVRQEKKITTVSELVEIIEKSKKKNYAKKINVCTKTFQALRIFVNKETTELIEGIIQATKLVKSGGKIIIISFHSIEDKIIKFYFKNYSKNKSNPSRYFPVEKNNRLIFFEDYKNNFLTASKEELIKNPPSRSAKLRFVIRNSSNFEEPKEFRIKFKRYLDLEGINV
tara:strand:+ start:705 stop:1721 length:1017 start_codon:yes stop_codon:yes gene_type:complete